MVYFSIATAAVSVHRPNTFGMVRGGGDTYILSMCICVLFSCALALLW